MADNPYQQSNLGGAPVQPAAPGYAPSQLPGVTPGVGTPGVVPAKPAAAPIGAYPMSPLDYTSHVESGNRNIPQQIHDRNTDKGTPASGYWQFIDPTWRRRAIQAGVDINKYPTPMSAPRDVQAQVAAMTPGTEFGPRTQAMLKAKYPGIDLSKPLGYYGGTAGGGGSASAPQPSTAPAATPTVSPPTVGGMLGMLNDPGPSGRSVTDNLGGMAQSSPAQQPPPLNVQGQMAAMYGNQRQQQIAQNAAAMNAALMQRAAQPLSWGSRPPGSMAGPQNAPPVQTLMGGQQIPMPGTTLNSMGNYGGG